MVSLTSASLTEGQCVATIKTASTTAAAAATQINATISVDWIYQSTEENTVVLYTLFSFYFILVTISVFLHLLGLYMMSKAKQKSNQHLFIINLSLSQMLLNAVFLHNNILLLMTHSQGATGSISSSYIFVSSAISRLVAGVPYILALFFITGDRLAATVLNFRYRSVCTLRRGKIVASALCFSFLVELPIVIVLVCIYSEEFLIKVGFVDIFVTYIPAISGMKCSIHPCSYGT